MMHVAVLRGGPSGEYDVSLESGRSVLEALQDRHIGHDIFISRDGVWHTNGLEISPEKVFRQCDVVFNALHGEYGEDGKLQDILEKYGVRFTGSGKLASAIAMNKRRTKEIWKQYDTKTPHFLMIDTHEYDAHKLRDIFNTFPHPCVVKPVSAGSSLGVSIVRTYNELVAGVAKASKYNQYVLLEEYISGKEATCGVVEGLRGEDLYALLPVEIIPPKESGFFDYDAKYSGKSTEVCPGSFTKEEKMRMQNIARRVHDVLGLRHYSRTDFILHPRRGIYAIEVNTLPGLSKESLLPKSLSALGISMEEFVDHVLTKM